MKRNFSPRILAVCLCAVLCLASVPGCGNSSSDPAKLLDPKNPTTIQVWTYYNGPQKLAFDDLVLEFNDTVGKETGIAVETISHSNVNDLTQSVLDAAAKKVGASDIPQVFSAYADTAYQVDQMGLVASLDAYLTPEELAEFIPEYMEEGRFDAEGTLKIFPTAKSTEVMMLNKTYWDEFATATGAALEELGTMEGVTRVAARYYDWTNSLTPEPDDGKAFFGRDAVANYFIIGCKQLGMEIFSVQNGTVTVNCDKAVLRRLWDCFYVPFLQGHFTANGRFRSDDLKTGDIIAAVCSTSGAAYFPTEVNLSDTQSSPIEPVALPVPMFEGGTRVAVQQGAGMVVAKSTPVQEYASVVFLKWFTEAERNVQFSTASGYMPVKTVANNLELLQAALAQAEPSAVTKNLAVTLSVNVDTVESCELYTNKAFKNGTEARAILENSLIDRIKGDLAQVAELTAQGMPRAEAIAQFTTDESFESWYSAFSQELATVANQ